MTFVWAVFGGLVVGFVGWLLYDTLTGYLPQRVVQGLIVGIPVAAAVIGLLLAIFSRRVSFEVGGRTLRYYKKNELKLQIDDLSQYVGGYSQTTRNGDVEKQVLYLTPLTGQGRPQEIDCAELSAGRFNQMFAYMQQCGLQKDVPTLNAQPQTLIAQPPKGI